MDTRKMKIMIVEDDAIIAMDIAALLVEMGFEVAGITHASGDAVEMARSARPDLILMDIIIEGPVDGIETASIIRERFGVPVIYLTAHADEMTVKTARSTAPYGYILKPVNPRELYSNIDAALNRRELEKQLELKTAELEKLNLELRESEQRRRLIIENSGDIIYTLDRKGVFTFVSPGWTFLLGHAVEEVEHHPFQVFVHPDDIAACEEFLSRVLETRQKMGGVEYRVMHADGTWRWHTTNGSPILDSAGSILGFVGIARDITDRKARDERLLRYSAVLPGLMEQHFWFDGDPMQGIRYLTELGARLMETRRVSVWLYSYDMQSLNCHDLYDSLLNDHRSGDMIASSRLRKYMENHSQGRVIAATDVFTDERTRDIPDEYFRSGDIQSLLDAPVWVRGKLAGVLSFEQTESHRRWFPEEEQLAVTLAMYVSACIEAFEKRSIETALRESELFLNSVIQGFPIPIFVIDSQHKLQYWNRALEEISGISAEEVLRTNQQWRAFYDRERPCLADLLVDGAESSIQEWYQDKCRKSDLIPGAYEGVDFISRLVGEGRWLRFTAAMIKNAAGELIGAIETLEDITPQKEAELSLRESEQKYRTLVENIDIGVFRTSADRMGNFMHLSRAMAKIFGYESIEQLQRLSVADFYFDPNDRKTVLDRLVNTGSVRNFEVRMKKLDGSIIWASITATLKFDEGGRPLWIDGIVEDISDRRRAEEALRESEDRLRTLINAMPDIVCLKDGEGHWLEANDYDIDFFGLRGVDYRGKTDADLAELSPLFREAFLNCVESDEVAWAARAPVRSDEEVILPGGGAMIFDIIKVPMFYRDGRRRGLIVVGRDITGRRSVEDTLRKSLGEKEVLLKEIHHRVKNNLNIIVSLLSMQAEKEKNARARDSLTMTRTRIFAIAQIHELLYQMDNLALIDFRAYIEKMISRLHALYVMAPKRVREVLDVRDVMLDVNHAVPCGVLINEILTNSYKHAFEERDEGEISVTFYREGDVFRLIIADNGRGLAGDFSRETHGSLGLDLIHVLAENQLKGTMIVSSANGLRYEIEIPAPAVKNGMQ